MHSIVPHISGHPQPQAPQFTFLDGSLSGIPSPRELLMFRVLFVCMANLCRSPMACNVAIERAQDKGWIHTGWSALYKRNVVNFDSAGTHTHREGEPMDPRGQRVLERHGYRVRDSRSRRMTRHDLSKFDLIVALDNSVLRELKRRHPDIPPHKVSLLMDFAPGSEGLDVPDPYYSDINGFETVLRLSEEAINGLLMSIEKQLIKA